MSDVTQGNEAEVRDQTGTIQDQSPPPPTKDTTSTTTQLTEKDTTEKAKPEGDQSKKDDQSKDDTSLLGKEDDKKDDNKAEGAPEKYEDFKLPEGVTLEAESLTKAQELFKGLGLSQEAAQSLVDFHVNVLKAVEDSPAKEWSDQQTKWQAEVRADPTLGPRLSEIKANYSKMLSAMGDPALEKSFHEMVEFTGAGNNPTFIKMMDKLSAHFTEGKSVQGGKPAQVREPGKASGPGAAAMFPGLPNAS